MKSAIFIALLIAITFVSNSLAQEVVSNTHSISVAYGGNLSVYSTTYSQISTGMNITDLMLNSERNTLANNANYLFSELKTKVIYKKDGVVYVKETYSSTSTSAPKEMSVEQKIGNLLDLWNSKSAESIVENVISLNNESYVFKSESLIPFNKNAVIMPPKYPKYLNMKDFKVTFGNGYSNTVEGDGIKYSGGMLIKTEISLR